MKDKNMLANSFFRILDNCLTGLFKFDLITMETRVKVEKILQEEIKWEICNSTISESQSYRLHYLMKLLPLLTILTLLCGCVSICPKCKGKGMVWYKLYDNESGTAHDLLPCRKCQAHKDIYTFYEEER